MAIIELGGRTGRALYPARVYAVEDRHSTRRRCCIWHKTRPCSGSPFLKPKLTCPPCWSASAVWWRSFRSIARANWNPSAFSLFRERASFLDGQTIRLANSGLTLTADHFVIATGSHPQFPAIPGLREAKPWTSDDILELDTLPKSLIVLGGGVVACELAQYLLRLGVRVTQIQRSPHILKEASTKASQTIESAFRKEGMDLYTGTRIHGIERDAAAGEFVVSFEHGGERCTARGAHIFNALGREPNVESLDLEAAGVRLTPGGQIQTDDYQQTTNPRIYAAGDVTGPYEIVHIAIMQGGSRGQPRPRSADATGQLRHPHERGLHRSAGG